MSNHAVSPISATRIKGSAAALAAAVLCLMGAAQPGGGGVQDGAPVGVVRFEGLSLVDEGYLRSLIRTQAGEPFSSQALSDDIDRLFRSGKFDDVDASSAAATDGQVVVTFRVVERPVISGVEYVGNVRYSVADLAKEVELSEGAPLSDYTIRRGVDALERKYKEAGYYYAKVSVDEDALRGERRVIFNISEGPRVRVRQIVFEGATAFSDFRLNGKIETKTYIWLLRTGDIDDERAQRDAAALAAFYREEGYLDAQVGYELQFADNGEDLTVKFVISEGVRYKIRTIDFKGVTVFPVEQLLEQMRLKPEDFLTAERLNADIRKVTDVYQEGGYVYADVRSDWVYAAEPEYVNLTLSVREGGQFRFGRIIVRGNERTQDKVIRRVLDFFPDDLYDRTATTRAEQRLMESQLFSEARISPVGEESAARDALVEVTERDTTQILFGVGVTSNSGLVGNVSLENRNFDLFDWPRDTKEFFSGRSFRGAGQTVRLNLEPGTEFNRFRIDFREPYLADQPYGGNIGAYLFTRGFDEYDIRRIGFNTSVDHRFRVGPLRDWAVEAAFRFENVDLSDVDFFSDPDIKADEGQSWLTSIKGSIVRNTTDSLFLPTRGSRLSLSWEQFGAMGGDYTFGRVTGDYNQFFTLYTDTFDRKHVLAVGGTAADIVGDAPVFERFYGGGIGSIRGFDFRGVGPRGGFIIEDDRIGGEFMLLVNAEYSFPLVGKLVRGVAFVDMGTVEEGVEISTWRAAIGLGARVYIPFFGPIPLTFDFALPVAKDDDDDTRVFSFAIGTTF